MRRSVAWYGTPARRAMDGGGIGRRVATLHEAAGRRVFGGDGGGAKEGQQGEEQVWALRAALGLGGGWAGVERQADRGPDTYGIGVRGL